MSKNTIIGILVAIIFILGGGLVYLNFMKGGITESSSGTTGTETVIDDSSTQEVTESSSTNNSNGCAKYIDAVFYGQSVGSNYDIRETLTLDSTGSFSDCYADSECRSGSYSIENGKITLVSPGDEVNDAYTVSNAISEDCTTITKNGDVKTLTRK